MKKVTILGSSGSIGENVLRVIEQFPDKYEIVGLAVRSNAERVLEQARQFNVERVVVVDDAAARDCADKAGGIAVRSGEKALADLAGAGEADLVFCAVVGMAGLKPVMAAIEAGADIALATKEVLVAAGQVVMDAAAERGVRILPVDSEHSALFQCLEGKPIETVRRIILTASGGPFAANKEIDLANVTVEQVLNHPRWDMGRKVTVDSATLMNKGFEIMEARWLFDIELPKIDVVIHPESIVHSLVEFVDGSTIAQLSLPDMRYPIQYALTYPGRFDGALAGLNLPEIGALHFDEPDEERFSCLRLAREAAQVGGTMPAVLNAANEVAVQSFLDGKMGFSRIWCVLEEVMSKHDLVTRPTLDSAIEADSWAREAAYGYCASC